MTLVAETFTRVKNGRVPRLEAFKYLYIARHALGKLYEDASS